jgi:hypothetical protein
VQHPLLRHRPVEEHENVSSEELAGGSKSGAWLSRDSSAGWHGARCQRFAEE